MKQRISNALRLVSAWYPIHSSKEVVEAQLDEQYLNLQPLQKTRASLLMPPKSSERGEGGPSPAITTWS